MATPAIVEICAGGDLVVRIKDEPTGFDQAYRCNRKRLRRFSKFFDALLDPERFGEGAAIERALKELFPSRENLNPYTIDPTTLPVVLVHDLPTLGAATSSMPSIMKFCMSALLGEPSSCYDCGDSRAMLERPLELVAQVVSVAERFSALEIVKAYAHGVWMVQSIPRSKGSVGTRSRETLLRQKLYSGMLLVSATRGYNRWCSEVHWRPRWLIGQNLSWSQAPRLLGSSVKEQR